MMLNTGMQSNTIFIKNQKIKIKIKRFCSSIYNDDVLNEKDPFKCYIVIYMCSSTRGVILDVVADVSAE